jgi:hypothetical protein
VARPAMSSKRQAPARKPPAGASSTLVLDMGGYSIKAGVAGQAVRCAATRRSAAVGGRGALHRGRLSEARPLLQADPQLRRAAQAGEEGLHRRPGMRALSARRRSVECARQVATEILDYSSLYYRRPFEKARAPQHANPRGLGSHARAGRRGTQRTGTCRPRCWSASCRRPCSRCAPAPPHPRSRPPSGGARGRSRRRTTHCWSPSRLSRRVRSWCAARTACRRRRHPAAGGRHCARGAQKTMDEVVFEKLSFPALCRTPAARLVARAAHEGLFIKARRAHGRHACAHLMATIHTRSADGARPGPALQLLPRA